MRRSLLFWLLCTVLHMPASSYDLRITPRRAHILVKTSLKIMCQADVPLTACQFKRTFATEIYNMSAGLAMKPTSDYSYYGVGLEHGQCGINLHEYIKDHTYDLVGCRVKAEDGVWKYAYMSLVVNSNESPIYDMEPRDSVVLPGSNYSVLCRAGEELSSCQMKWSNQPWTALTKSTLTDVYKYNGAGVEKGQCGVTFINVTDSINGNVFCAGWTKAKPKGYESDASVIIVAKPPDKPTLTLDKSIYFEDDVMHACCFVNNSRPVSNITWYYGDTFLRNDALDETTDDSRWRWSYDNQSITQHVTRKLTWEDDGKEVLCRADHVALPGGSVDAKETIRVLYAPLQQTSSSGDQSVSIGETVASSIRVQANPRPSFSWQVGTLVVEEGTYGDNGRIEALQGTLVDSNVWEMNLTICSLTWNDTELDGVVLTARNSVGETMYNISWVLETSTVWPDYTDNTDDGNDIDIDNADSSKRNADGNKSSKSGVIIGSVIGITVLIGAAMLVTYARLNRKWCFVLSPGSAQFQNAICLEDDEVNDNQNVYLNM